MKLRLLLCLCLVAQYIAAQNTSSLNQQDWVDSVFSTLSAEQKLGQLFNIRANSNQGQKHEGFLKSQIEKYHIGGVTFFQGEPTSQVRITNDLQRYSKVPMMIAMDAEWGLGMRMKSSTISYPKQLMLGAIEDNKSIYDFGKAVAEHCKRLGVHMNFAPVVDINNNPNNPVIHERSFGENKYNVTAKSYMYIKGLQDHGVLACAKHFPGHGDTDVDSHKDLPVINHDRNRLDSIELYPFKLLAHQGLAAMMIAHLYIPSIDDTENTATTLSPKAVKHLLKEEIGYKGLAITDGLDMKGVAKFFEPGELEVKAFQAGNDILLLSENVGAAFTSLKKAIAQGTITWAEVDERVQRILAAKYNAGLAQYKPISAANIYADVNHKKYKNLKSQLIEESLTLLRNEDKLLPLVKGKHQSIAVLSLGSLSPTKLQSQVALYGKNVQFFNQKHQQSSSTYNSLLGQLKRFDVVVVGLHNLSNRRSKDYGISAAEIAFLEALNQQNKTINVVFNTPYTLSKLDKLNNILVAYQQEDLIETIVGDALFGATTINGHLPITASPLSQYGMGEYIKGKNIFRWSTPEAMGMNRDTLNEIDKLALDAIKKKATPGCQILVAKGGKIVYNKSFGHHRYDQQQPVKNEHAYDLASITKVAATTIAMMKLHEEGIINVNDKVSKYLPELDTTNKKDITIVQVLSHQAQLKPWIPFYKNTVELTPKGRFDRLNDTLYQTQHSPEYNVMVCDNIYMNNCYVDTIWTKIYNSDLRSKKGYRYSDLGFIMMAKLVKAVTNKPLDQYVDSIFYKPMGLQTTTFTPQYKIDINNIPPTENDKYFRNKEVHGHVHDMAAAMLGGVSGHAGLFSNAEDLAAIFQMLLNEGTYNNIEFLTPSTINYFTTRYNDTRRGIGWDMKELETDKKKRRMNMSPLASPSTFGHLGFTGTCVWTDPTKDLIYVFLSNRTYPNMNNFRLNKHDYRPRIQSLIYNAIQH